MSTNTEARVPSLLFQRRRVAANDERVFAGKLLVAATLGLAGGYLAVQRSWIPAGVGVVLLAAAYTHWVELQHQCLHHSAFHGSRSKLHRAVGIPLGMPMMVMYSHYRVRHLQHHKYLGTARDSEFFGFDTRRPITWKLLLLGLFDYRRLVAVSRDIVDSFRGRWTYNMGEISEGRRREIMAEHWVLGVLVLAAAGLAAIGHYDVVLRLWVIPLLIATPLHFLVELPEHILCDTDSTDVLRNTRSIRGSWLSTWFTNGNNLHVEHHAAMVVPINRLRERHDEVVALGAHVERTYLDFYRLVLRTARSNSRK